MTVTDEHLAAARKACDDAMHTPAYARARRMYHVLLYKRGRMSACMYMGEHGRYPPGYAKAIEKRENPEGWASRGGE